MYTEPNRSLIEWRTNYGFNPNWDRIYDRVDTLEGLRAALVEQRGKMLKANLEENLRAQRMIHLQSMEMAQAAMDNAVKLQTTEMSAKASVAVGALDVQQAGIRTMAEGARDIGNQLTLGDSAKKGIEVILQQRANNVPDEAQMANVAALFATLDGPELAVAADKLAYAGMDLEGMMELSARTGAGTTDFGEVLNVKKLQQAQADASYLVNARSALLMRAGSQTAQYGVSGTDDKAVLASMHALESMGYGPPPDSKAWDTIMENRNNPTKLVEAMRVLDANGELDDVVWAPAYPPTEAATPQERARYVEQVSKGTTSVDGQGYLVNKQTGERVKSEGMPVAFEDAWGQAEVSGVDVSQIPEVAALDSEIQRVDTRITKAMEMGDSPWQKYEAEVREGWLAPHFEEFQRGLGMTPESEGWNSESVLRGFARDTMKKYRAQNRAGRKALRGKGEDPNVGEKDAATTEEVGVPTSDTGGVADVKVSKPERIDPETGWMTGPRGGSESIEEEFNREVQTPEQAKSDTLRRGGGGGSDVGDVPDFADAAKQGAGIRSALDQPMVKVTEGDEEYDVPQSLIRPEPDEDESEFDVPEVDGADLPTRSSKDGLSASGAKTVAGRLADAVPAGHLQKQKEAQKEGVEDAADTVAKAASLAGIEMHKTTPDLFPASGEAMRGTPVFDKMQEKEAQQHARTLLLRRKRSEEFSS